MEKAKKIKNSPLETLAYWAEFCQTNLSAKWVIIDDLSHDFIESSMRKIYTHDNLTIEFFLKPGSGSITDSLKVKVCYTFPSPFGRNLYLSGSITISKNGKFEENPVPNHHWLTHPNIQSLQNKIDLKYKLSTLT